MCKVYTDVGGINSYTMFVHLYVEIIHSLKLVDYLHVQADNQWYNYYLTHLSLASFVWTSAKSVVPDQTPPNTASDQVL